KPPANDSHAAVLDAARNMVTSKRNAPHNLRNSPEKAPQPRSAAEPCDKEVRQEARMQRDLEQLLEQQEHRECAEAAIADRIAAAGLRLEPQEGDQEDRHCDSEPEQ